MGRWPGGLAGAPSAPCGLCYAWRCEKAEQFAFFPRESTRWVRIVLTVAHLNHQAGDDRDENLKALCQWCHLNFDKVHHAETRATRKDAARPLLSLTKGATL